MAESGWQIPDDWDGESWACWQVAFPDSEKYRRLLVGLFFALTRGREYDRESGNIKDAQAAGWEIFDANFPLIACDSDDILTPDGELIPAVCRSSLTIEVSEVGQVVTDVQIVDGKLRVFYGKCCYEDFDLAVTQSVAPPELPETPYDDTEYSGTAFSACGMATAFVDLVFAAVDSIHDESTNPLAWQWKGNVERDLPGVSIGALSLIAAIGQYNLIKVLDTTTEYFYLDGVWDHETIKDSTLAAKWKARAAAVFEADGTRPTQGEITAAFQAGVSLYPPSVQTFLTHVYLAVGWGDFADAAVMGALDTTAVCEDVTVNPYYGTGTLKINSVAYTGTSGVIQSGELLYGYRWIHNFGVDSPQNYRVSNAALTMNNASVRYFRLRLSGARPTREWTNSCPTWPENTAWPSVTANGTGVNPTVTITTDGNDLIFDYDLGEAKTVNTLKWDSNWDAGICPQNIPGAAQWQSVWTLESSS